MSEAARWAPPAVQGRLVSRFQDRPTAADLDEIGRAAWEEGHANGLRDGLAAAAADAQRLRGELDAKLAQVSALLDSLGRPVGELDEETVRQLATLAMTVGRHLVRRELRIEPSQVIGILRDTVAMLPAAAQEVRVHLHPEDARLVNAALAAPASGRAWEIVEDPVLARGGCRVTARHTRIDASLEGRIQAAIAHVLGDEREPSARDAT
ncbi:MAG: hypothetical protein CMLOHMNK_00678 [Steroidobacteraceae bacterium]|nr:hypothetical protein [Steroidobacteraceae bacterium]